MTPPEHDGAAVEKNVRSSLVAQYAQALLILLVPAAVVLGTVYTTMRAEIAGKADKPEVEELKLIQKTQDAALQRFERRQILIFCKDFPQSFECQPSERNNSP